MEHIEEMSAEAAKESGFRPITIGYQLPCEQRMLDNVLADMKRGNVRVLLIPNAEGEPEVWRHGSEIRTFVDSLNETLKADGTMVAA